MLLLIVFAFLSGLVTILAPCIWPLLPIVLSSSVAGSGGHKRPLGITLGIMLSFTIFTLFISYLIKFFHLDPNVLRVVAVVILALLGVFMIIPGVNAILELGISRLTGFFNRSGQAQGTGFAGGFITGLSLGIVWSPCAGPILAAIATLAATGQVSLQVLLVTLAYVTGVGIPLFIFAYAGQKFISNSRKLSPYLGRIQQVFGVIMILTAILIYTNKAQDFQLYLVNKFPVLDSVFNGFETGDTVTKELNTLKGGRVGVERTDDELFNVTSPIQAPEFAGISQWLNNPDGAGKDSKPLSMAELRGKVVLVDFWTYTCINCIRTLPHVTSWYDRYHNAGFVVIGVHTPEFAFEKETGNVIEAIKRFNIHYPVAQDNDYATWTAYSNQYWPAEYLIDAKGQVRRVHFGEGEYDRMEEAIRVLLKENGKIVTGDINSMPDATPHGQISPETYIGSKRMQYLADVGQVGNGEQTFAPITKIQTNEFAFSGTWNIMDEYSVTEKGAALSYHFYAGSVYLVMRPESNTSSQVKVLIDGKTPTAEQAGKDVTQGIVTVNSDRLYELIDLHGKTGDHLLTLQFPSGGVELFAFTFGN